MSITYEVTMATRQLGKATAIELAHVLHGYTPLQVLHAMKNAARKGDLYVVTKGRPGRNVSAPAVFAPTGTNTLIVAREIEPAAVRIPLNTVRPYSSVFDYAQRVAA